MRSSWRERRACCGYLNQGRGLSPLPSGEDNDAQLFAQTRTLRIRQLNGFDLSIVESTSPLRAVASIPLTDFHGVSRARGPKRQLTRLLGTAKYLIIPSSRAHLGLAFGLNLGKLLGDSAAVTVTLDCLLHHGRARVIRESAQHSTPSPLLIDGGERRASVSAYDAHLCRFKD